MKKKFSKVVLGVILGLMVTMSFMAFMGVANAEAVFRIEVGNDYKHYSTSDLQRRIWELERAVFQIQAKVFQLEMGSAPKADSWVCTINAMGEDYTGTGGSKAVATDAALKSCKSGRGGDGFFCKNPKCAQ